MKWNPFENIGQNLKHTAILLYWLETIAEIIACIILLISFDEQGLGWLGPTVLFGGIFFTTLSNGLLYGFGELLCRCRSIDEKLERLEKSKQPASQQTAPKATPKNVKIESEKTQPAKKGKQKNGLYQWKCDSCGAMINKYPCSACGHNVDDITDESFFVDVVCPECEETISFPKETLGNKKEVQCPMCDAKIQCSDL